MFSFEWALTHRSYPRILPDSSNFPGAISKFISKFDVRMSYRQSYVFLQDLSNSFHCWFNISILHCSGVFHQLSWWLSSSFSTFQDQGRRISLESWSVLLKIHGSNLLPSSQIVSNRAILFLPIRAFQSCFHFLIIQRPSF